MKKEVYGRLSLSWGGNVVLPLEQAHKVQAILAQYGVGIGDAYRPDEPNIKYIMDYKTPDVTVTSFPDYDCTGLTPQQISDWEQSVRDSQGDTFLSPQQFIAIRGE